jgi:hypothetical protein
LTKEGHFAPPSVGEPGFYVCQRSEDYAGLVKRLREMAEHGGAPSRLATMRAAADAIGTLERELNRANSQVAVAGHQVEEVVRETRLMKASVEAREWQPIATVPEDRR